MAIAIAPGLPLGELGVNLEKGGCRCLRCDLSVSHFNVIGFKVIHFSVIGFKVIGFNVHDFPSSCGSGYSSYSINTCTHFGGRGMGFPNRSNKNHATKWTTKT